MKKLVLSLLTLSMFLGSSSLVLSSKTNATPIVTEEEVINAGRLAKSFFRRVIEEAGSQAASVTVGLAGTAIAHYIQVRVYKYDGTEYRVCREVDQNKRPLGSWYFCDKH